MSPLELDKYFNKNGADLSEVSASDIQIIREWLSKQPHLPDISDRQISIFLHSCYNAIEATKKTIDSYYTIRTHATELFNNRTPAEVHNCLNIVYCVCLANVDGCQYLMMGFRNSDPSVFNLLEAIRMATCRLDILTNECPYMSSFRLLFDMSGFTFGHLAKISANLGIVRKVICYVQDALPVRLKGIHIFNAIPLVHQFLALVKPLMNKELYDLINVHMSSEMDSFYQVVPKENLPENYGGGAPSLDVLINVSNNKMETYKQWFVEDEKVSKVNEDKRLEKLKNGNAIFGTEGSFKKIEFD